ncbi:unnamed protein product [Thlaspi arvense]|uniref:Uncharacterized protein n=1 Tax=Thlaspi arvense TaxID=13288 RepID=A0AAU9RG33_THLAR|nr:unnamed protein product [Thlaspi arvense]
MDKQIFNVTKMMTKYVQQANNEEDEKQRWVPFDIAKPLLDRRPYVILSDYTGLPNGAISSSGMLENIVHPHHDDPSQEDTNDIPMDEDEEMAEVDSDDSDEKADLQSSDLPSLQVEGSVNDILIRLNGVHLGYKQVDLCNCSIQCLV